MLLPIPLPCDKGFCEGEQPIVGFNLCRTHVLTKPEHSGLTDLACRVIALAYTYADLAASLRTMRNPECSVQKRSGGTLLRAHSV